MRTAREEELQADAHSTVKGASLPGIYDVLRQYNRVSKTFTDASGLDTGYPDTQELMKNLIALYHAWGQPEKAQEWRAKLPQTEAARE